MAKRIGQMRIIAFISDHDVVDRIINHQGFTFIATKPPPPHVFEQVVLLATEESIVIVKELNTRLREHFGE